MKLFSRFIIFIFTGVMVTSLARSVQAATVGVTTSANTVQVDVANRYRAVFTTNDTTDYLIIRDRAQSDSSPNATYEFIGPYIREGGTEYHLRYDDNRVTSIIEATDTRVQIRITGCLDTTAGGACLASGSSIVMVTEEYSFTPDGFSVSNTTNFQTSGVALDNSAAEDGYNWLMMEADVTDAGFSGTYYYGDGSTESNDTADASFEETNTYIVFPGTSTYQSAIVGLSKGGWFDQSGGTDNWNLDVNNSGTLDRLHSRERNGTPTGTHKAYWYFLLLPQANLDSEAEREAYNNDYQNPDNLRDGIVSPAGIGWGWGHTSELTNLGADDYWNQAENLYTLEASTSAVRFDLDGNTYSRFNPVIKYRNYRLLTDPTPMTLEGSSLTNSTHYNQAPKPFTTSYFAQDLTFAASLENSTVDVGSSLTEDSNDYASGKYGKGARFDADGESLRFSAASNISMAKGTLEFWYQPSYDYADNNQHELFFCTVGTTFEPASDDFFEVTKIDDNSFSMWIQNAGGTDYHISISSSDYSWSAGEWVHFRVTWDDTESTANQMRIFMNGVEPTHTDSFTDYDSSQISVDTCFIGNGDTTAPVEANGIIDELKIYNDDASLTKLSEGGDTADTDEYLADTSNDYTFTFSATSGNNNRGEYFWTGTNAQFGGVNVDLATLGVGSSEVFEWEYWNGTAWSALTVTETTSGSSEWKADGNFYFTPPSDWAVYSVNGSPDLYFIRGHLESGSYSTNPIEDSVFSDIQLYQYLSSVTQADQTFGLGTSTETSFTFRIAGVNSGVVNNQITTSISSSYNLLPFDHLTNGQPKYMAHELYVSTTASGGYVVNVKLRDNHLQGVYPANYIDPFNAVGATWTTPVVWSVPTGTQANTDTGWIGANTTDTRVLGWTSGNGKFGPVSSTPNTVMSATSADESGSTIYVTYAIEVNGLQPADLYTGSIQYSVIPTY